MERDLQAPSARGARWDRLVPAAIVIGIVLVIADAVWSFTLAPLVQGAELSGSRTITVDAGAAVERPTDPVRAGYAFEGWYADPALTEPYDFAAPVDEDVTLYAKWSGGVEAADGYAVRFALDGGGGLSSSEVRVQAGATVQRPAADPVREGYDFEGWYADPACTEPYDFDAPVSADTTLYAKWSGEGASGERSVSFVSNGGSSTVMIGGHLVTTKLLLSQKIFYLHVPVAVASFAMMLAAAVYSVRLLMTGDRRLDVRAKTAMEVTLVFIVATMISGDLWTRFEWGVWWVWEPRLTTYFILMLLVIGYFILRNAFDDPERRARFAAVFCIVAFIDAPISFLVTRLIPSSIHPVVFRTDSGLPPLMLIPFLLGLFGAMLLAFALYRIAARINSDALEVETLKELLEAADAQAQRAAADEALERLRAAGARVASGAGAGDAAAAGIAPEAAVRNHNPEVVGSNQAVQQGEAAAGVASVPSDSPKED